MTNEKRVQRRTPPTLTCHPRRRRGRGETEGDGETSYRLPWQYTEQRLFYKLQTTPINEYKKNNYDDTIHETTGHEENKCRHHNTKESKQPNNTIHLLSTLARCSPFIRIDTQVGVHSGRSVRRCIVRGAPRNKQAGEDQGIRRWKGRRRQEGTNERQNKRQIVASKTSIRACYGRKNTTLCLAEGDIEGCGCGTGKHRVKKW